MEISKIKDFSNWIYKAGEINDSTKKNEDFIKLFLALNTEFDILNVDKKTLKNSKKQYQMKNKSFIKFIKMNENNYILSGRGGSSYYINLFSPQMTQYKITEKTYSGAIKINKNVALTSNKIIVEGEEKLLIYNSKRKSSYEINGFSPTLGINNLMLMPREEIKSSFHVLLCACKKYIDGQKNGILLVNPELGLGKNNNDIKEPFYETNNFEVYCFCPILIVENKNDNFDNINEKYRKNIKITDTDYFLVGGFDIDKKEGAIKLFKMIYGNKALDTTIDFIQDIEIEDSEGFELFDGPINCLIQSKISGNILACCYNGKVYLFTPPNIDYYLKNGHN